MSAERARALLEPESAGIRDQQSGIKAKVF